MTARNGRGLSWARGKWKSRSLSFSLVNGGRSGAVGDKGDVRRNLGLELGLELGLGLGSKWACNCVIAQAVVSWLGLSIPRLFLFHWALSHGLMSEVIAGGDGLCNCSWL